MKDIIVRQNYLPATLEELNQFVLVQVEKLKHYRAKLQTIDRLELADGVRKQTLEDGHKIGEALLWAEAKMGEILKSTTKGTFKKGGEKSLPEGMSRNRSSRLQQLAANQDLIKEVLDEARANEDLPTRSEVLRKAKEREVKKNIDRIRSTPAKTTTGKYQTIVIDPPWPMEKIGRKIDDYQDVGFDYPTMSLEEIKEFGIEKLAEDSCHLYMWTTQKFLPDSFEILKAWGFEYIFTMVWHKSGGFQPFKLPQYNCEFILFGKRGSLPFLDTKNFFTCFNGKRREHSRKPDEFYELISRVSPNPRIDIFSREKREGFDQYGNEESKFNVKS